MKIVSVSVYSYELSLIIARSSTSPSVENLQVEQLGTAIPIAAHIQAVLLAMTTLPRPHLGVFPGQLGQDLHPVESLIARVAGFKLASHTRFVPGGRSNEQAEGGHD